MRILSKLASAALIASGLTLSAVEAAECKIEGPMLLQAYSRALNNGGRFVCLKNGYKDATFQFLPTPNGLICQHHKEVLPKNSVYNMKLFGDSPSTAVIKNGWWIASYRTTGGGRKNKTGRKFIHFRKVEKDNIGFKLTLQSMTLAKKNASCRDLRAVIRNAFGD